jgi:hypothetical protein
MWAWQRSRYSNWLRAGRSGDRIPVEGRFSAPVQTGPGAHPASCKMGTRSFQGVKSGRGVMLTPRPLLVPWSWKSWAVPLLPLWAVRPVQSLSAYTGVHYTFTFTARICPPACREIYFRDSDNKEPLYVLCGTVSSIMHILCPPLRLRLRWRK